MTSMSFRNSTNRMTSIAPSALQYRDVGPAPSPSLEQKLSATLPKEEPKSMGPSPAEIEQLVAAARAEASAETEHRLRGEMNESLASQTVAIEKSIQTFVDDQKSYFARVESEVVNLALAIAAKILHRQAQVDPTLIAALVRVAIEKLHDGSAVSVRANPVDAARWRKTFTHLSNSATVAIIEDTQLGTGECVLETELGSASFGIEAQLKEVEQGFCDLLAQRPSL